MPVGYILPEFQRARHKLEALEMAGSPIVPLALVAAAPDSKAAATSTLSHAPQNADTRPFTAPTRKSTSIMAIYRRQPAESLKEVVKAPVLPGGRMMTPVSDETGHDSTQFNIERNLSLAWRGPVLAPAPDRVCDLTMLKLELQKHHLEDELKTLRAEVQAEDAEASRREQARAEKERAATAQLADYYDTTDIVDRELRSVLHASTQSRLRLRRLMKAADEESARVFKPRFASAWEGDRVRSSPAFALHLQTEAAKPQPATQLSDVPAEVRSAMGAASFALLVRREQQARSELCKEITKEHDWMCIAGCTLHDFMQHYDDCCVEERKERQRLLAQCEGGALRVVDRKLQLHSNASYAASSGQRRLATKEEAAATLRQQSALLDDQFRARLQQQVKLLADARSYGDVLRSRLTSVEGQIQSLNSGGACASRADTSAAITAPTGKSAVNGIELPSEAAKRRQEEQRRQAMAPIKKSATLTGVDVEPLERTLQLEMLTQRRQYLTDAIAQHQRREDDIGAALAAMKPFRAA